MQMAGSLTRFREFSTFEIPLRKPNDMKWRKPFSHFFMKLMYWACHSIRLVFYAY